LSPTQQGALYAGAAIGLTATVVGAAKAPGDLKHAMQQMRQQAAGKPAAPATGGAAPSAVAAPNAAAPANSHSPNANAPTAKSAGTSTFHKAGNAVLKGASVGGAGVAGVFIKGQYQAAHDVLNSNAPIDQKIGAVAGAAVGTSQIVHGATTATQVAVDAAKSAGVVGAKTAQVVTSTLTKATNSFLGPAGDVASITMGAANMKGDVQAAQDAFAHGSAGDKAAAVCNVASDGLSVVSGATGVAGDALIASGIGAPIGVFVKGVSVVAGLASAAVGAIGAVANKIAASDQQNCEAAGKAITAANDQLGFDAASLSPF
jgi:hypothetical protein